MDYIQITEGNFRDRFDAIERLLITMFPTEYSTVLQDKVREENVWAMFKTLIDRNVTSENDLSLENEADVVLLDNISKGYIKWIQTVRYPRTEDDKRRAQTKLNTRTK